METESHRIVVSIGSDSGDRRENVVKAIEWLSRLLGDFRSSDVYETPPYGHAGSNYMNAVASGVWNEDLKAFVRECKRYEVLCGRDLSARIRKEVPIDVDLVVADGETVRPEDFRREFFQIGFRQINQ